MRNKTGSLMIWLFLIPFIILPFISEFSYVFEDMNLNPNDYARITDVEYRAVVVDEPGSQGKVVITERLTFDVHAASQNNLFWELWRDLPEDYVDGVKVDYQVNSVKQILEDGTEVIYEESPKLYWEDEDYVSSNPFYGPGKWYHSEGPYDEAEAQYECVFFYVDGLYREEVVFEIEYEMHNAALRYRDCSDLYLSLYSGDTIKYLNSFKAEILFPNEDMPSRGNYDVYTYGTNSNDFPVTESDTLNPGYYTFSFELDEEQLQFKPYNQYIEFDLVSYGEDRHIFTEYAPSNYYSSDNVLDEIYEEQQEYADAPEKFAKIKTCVFVFSAAGALLIIIYSFTAGARMKAKHAFYKPAMEMKYFRDIPSDLDPNFAAALVFCKQKPPKDDSGVYSALLLSLARKEYIEIIEENSTNVRIIIKKTTPPPIQQPDLFATGQQSAFTTGQQNPFAMQQQNVFATEQQNPFTMQQQNLFAAEQQNSFTMQQPNLFATEQQNSFAMQEPVKIYEPLTTCEEYVFNLLVRHAVGNTISMNDFQSRVSADYENTNSFARNMENSIVNIGVREGYFQKGNYDQPKKQMLSMAKFLRTTGILLIVLVNIISNQTRLELAFGAFFLLGAACLTGSFYLKSQSHKYVLLTQFGEDEYAKWRGLYHFLNSDTLIHERTIIELPIWEKYLVYATAFGLSEKVIKAIRIRCPEATQSPVLNNTCYHSRSFHHSSHSFRSAVRSGSSVARGGGGFGYGGGGRGGGGGGGGH